jgi:hypothetical protein
MPRTAKRKLSPSLSPPSLSSPSLSSPSLSPTSLSPPSLSPTSLSSNLSSRSPSNSSFAATAFVQGQGDLEICWTYPFCRLLKKLVERIFKDNEFNPFSIRDKRYKNCNIQFIALNEQTMFDEEELIAFCFPKQPQPMANTLKKRQRTRSRSRLIGGSATQKGNRRAHKVKRNDKNNFLNALALTYYFWILAVNKYGCDGYYIEQATKYFLPRFMIEDRSVIDIHYTGPPCLLDRAQHLITRFKDICKTQNPFFGVYNLLMLGNDDYETFSQLAKRILDKGQYVAFLFQSSPWDWESGNKLCDDGHVVIVTKYSMNPDNTLQFICENSWGHEWNDGGRFIIDSYQVFRCQSTSTHKSQPAMFYIDYTYVFNDNKGSLTAYNGSKDHLVVPPLSYMDKRALAKTTTFYVYREPDSTQVLLGDYRQNGGMLSGASAIDDNGTYYDRDTGVVTDKNGI